jgi:hypothetical protein
MAEGRDKHQSRHTRELVRQILLNDWDPIGVRDEPAASDEYDRYADRAYVMLMDERATVETIAAYVDMIASERMGLGRNQRGTEISRHVAEKLAVLRIEVERADRRSGQRSLRPAVYDGRLLSI